jgi:energy-coupling factor transport system permease protein
MNGPSRMAPLLLGTLAGALVSGRLATAAVSLVLAGAAAAMAGARRPSAVWVRLLGAGMVVALVLDALLVPGRRLGGLPHVTVEGVHLGALMALRLAGAAVAMHGLAAAWPGERAADEVARLLAPLERLRVPVREARAVLALALRFAPLLGRESVRIARVQDVRAGGAPRGWRERFTRRRAVLIPVMVGALERAERVSLTLEARHHRLRGPSARPGCGGAGVWGWSLAGVAVAAVSLLWRG